MLTSSGAIQALHSDYKRYTRPASHRPPEFTEPVGGTVWETWTGGRVSQQGSKIDLHVQGSYGGDLTNLGEYNPGTTTLCEGKSTCAGLQPPPHSCHQSDCYGAFHPLHGNVFIGYSGLWGDPSQVTWPGYPPRGPVYQGFNKDTERFTVWSQPGGPADMATANDRSRWALQPALGWQEHCGPIITVGGQPQVVVVLIDGVGSQEDGGSAYPIPVADPAGGIAVVSSYCPVDPFGKERGWPAGLDQGLRRWSEFKVPGGSSGGSSSAPDTSRACETPGGLSAANRGKNHCLVATLADTGAVLLPYSYAGATLAPTPSGPVFTLKTYTADDTKQDPKTSITRLNDELNSIHGTWKQTRIVILGHSYGGTIAEEWWECMKGHCPKGTIAQTRPTRRPPGRSACVLVRFSNQWSTVLRRGASTCRSIGCG